MSDCDDLDRSFTRLQAQAVLLHGVEDGGARIGERRWFASEERTPHRLWIESQMKIVQTLDSGQIHNRSFGEARHELGEAGQAGRRSSQHDTDRKSTRLNSS